MQDGLFMDSVEDCFSMESVKKYFDLFNTITMIKSWYILYTKPDTERKTSASLERKKITHFLPLGILAKTNFARVKIEEEPLFPGYIFVLTTLSQLSDICRSDDSLNMVYWKDTPAVVPENEINSIKEFISTHENIIIKKIRVRADGFKAVRQFAPLTVDEKPLSLAETTHEITLPSLGYVLTAKADRHHKVTVISEKRNITGNKVPF